MTITIRYRVDGARRAQRRLERLARAKRRSDSAIRRLRSELRSMRGRTVR